MNAKRPLSKKLIFFAAIMLSIFPWRTYSFGDEWSKTFGGSGYEIGRSVQQTSDGGFIISGDTNSFGAGDDDVYLIKTDGDGNEQWGKTFDLGGSDRGRSVQQTTDGGFVIAGSIADADAFLLKTNGNGIEQWRKTFGGSNVDWADSVQQTADGGFIIVGGTNSFGAVNDDVYLIKTDGNGNELWYKTFGGTGDDSGNSVQQTADGGFIITGYTDSFGYGKYVYLIKTDAAGNEEWGKTFEGGNEGNSVRQTSDGGFIIVGEEPPIDSGYDNIYLIKTDGEGNEQWRKSFGGDNGEYGSSVEQTSDGGFIIAGLTASFGEPNGDVYLIKTDADGNEEWNKTFGGNEVDWGRSVQQTADGGFIIAGFTRSFGAGDHDVYLIYYSETEPPNWVDIDIKPGSEPNSINPRSRGVIPVAILTTDAFDASTVDPSMVLFGATGSEAAPVQSALKDVDRDGDIDMILHFKTQETGIQYGDASASLTGETSGGQMIQGSNCIQTVGDGKCFPPPAGLTSWWPGDYNADDKRDVCNATLEGDATIGRGFVGGAFILDGDGDFVNVPCEEALNVGTGDFTVDLWVFFNDTAGEQILAEKWIQRDPNTASEGWTLTKLENNVLLLAMANGSEDSGASSDILPIAAGTWTHFAATRLGSEVTLFMNGVPVAQGESSLNLNSASSLKFGHRGNFEDTPGSVSDQQFYLNGRIDEVHLFVDQALTQCQIQAIFNARKAGMCK